MKKLNLHFCIPVWYYMKQNSHKKKHVIHKDEGPCFGRAGMQKSKYGNADMVKYRDKLVTLACQTEYYYTLLHMLQN